MPENYEINEQDVEELMAMPSEEVTDTEIIPDQSTEPDMGD